MMDKKPAKKTVEKDGTLQLYKCPTCGNKVQNLFFHCVRCGNKVCYSCGRSEDIPFSLAHWCPVCHKWACNVISRELDKEGE